MPMNLCESNIELGRRLHEFMLNVPDAKEESLTDYLVWQWRMLDPTFRYVSAKSFSRMQESAVTGADFELELWIVGRRSSVPLLFQAKKFMRTYDSYVQRLKYPNGTQGQLTRLMSYAATNRRLPFYAIYTTFDGGRPMCAMGKSDASGVYMLSAHRVQGFIAGPRRLGLNDLLSWSNPLHCMFCCPIDRLSTYFERYFREAASGDLLHNTRDLPQYVDSILNGESIAASGSALEELNVVRTIGVYDLRDRDND